MDQNHLDEVLLHTAGAIVRHQSPFHDLPVLTRLTPMNHDQLLYWVKPFYMTDLQSEEFAERFLPVRNEITIDLVKELLAQFNWRPRLVAAMFAAIKNYGLLEIPIGYLLLRSDMCYAGKGYCLALATFNTTESVDFLTHYLDYYLKQKDLWYDQGEAMGAIAYLDQQNGTNVLAQFLPAWEEFNANKHWNLDDHLRRFAEQMKAIRRLRD
ncbi:MAG: hypothetical protein HY774_05455 [Acidobacteria bacterium]|nr:hypothetical protein [Acidobacteriota bacterium]